MLVMIAKEKNRLGGKGMVGVGCNFGQSGHEVLTERVMIE